MCSCDGNSYGHRTFLCLVSRRRLLQENSSNKIFHQESSFYFCKRPNRYGPTIFSMPFPALTIQDVKKVFGTRKLVLKIPGPTSRHSGDIRICARVHTCRLNFHKLQSYHASAIIDDARAPTPERMTHRVDGRALHKERARRQESQERQQTILKQRYRFI